jgi:excisionase family DNA binding protein
MNNSTAKTSPMLTLKVVAKRLEISERHARRLIWSGAIPHHRIGRAIRILDADLQEYLANTRRLGTV